MKRKTVWTTLLTTILIFCCVFSSVAYASESTISLQESLVEPIDWSILPAADSKGVLDDPSNKGTGSLEATLEEMRYSAKRNKSKENELKYAGIQLLEELLGRQFESYKTGELIDTSDIFLPSNSTSLYNQYLYWYTGLIEATQEYWTEYDFDLRFDSISGNELTFSADLSYGRTCSKYRSEQTNFPYVIAVSSDGEKYYISDIDTTEPNFYGFMNLASDNDVEETRGILRSGSITPISKRELDQLISEYADFKSACRASAVDPGKVEDMETSHEVYLKATEGAKANDKTKSLSATSYSYERERGRTYADQYYSNANACFYDATNDGGDCTNWVSQCVWAAYGGWTDGDDQATMAANIAARKRMQPSTSLDNWFGHVNGLGNPWCGVGNFWNFVTSSPATGPKANGFNDGKVWSGNFVSTDIVTGQVLQVHKKTQTNYKHSVYVTGGTNDAFENIKITQHTPNNRIMLDEFIRNWGSSSCYVRQLKFTSAYFNS